MTRKRKTTSSHVHGATSLYDICIKDKKKLAEPCQDCENKNEAKAVTMTLASFIKGEETSGLAAIQVSIPKRAFVARLQFDSGKKVIGFANPVIKEKSGEVVQHVENCFSIAKNRSYSVPRHTRIVVEDMLNGEITLTDEDAFVVQHEIDHLNGILISDKGKPAWAQPIKTKVRIGRNDLCPCGSGCKYKKCCM